MTSDNFIHATADVQSTHIGARSRIWQFAVVLSGARIGSDVNVCSHCFIENDVTIGDRVTVKSGVQLWDGIHIEDDVFIGPNVTFTNDKFPRSKIYPENFSQTRIKKNASIGAGAVILPGITIGEHAMIGAGAVVTKSVPAYAIVTSPAAQLKGYVENIKNTHDSKISRDSVDAPTQNTLSCGVGGVTLHNLKQIYDTRGELSVGEFSKDIPFNPKRYFVVTGVPINKIRGEHAHHECHQFLICVKGSCAVMVDDGTVRKEINLNSSSLGLYLPPLTWGVQYKYSVDAVLLVFASDYYKTEDYIHDYSVFCDLVKTV